MQGLFQAGKRLKTIGWLVAGLLLLIIAVLEPAGPLFSWPHADEANYTWHALKIAQGYLPYRDFYDFVTPGSMLIVALFIKLNGFSMIGIRLWILMGWLAEMALLYEMSKQRMSKLWMGLFLAFLWIADSRFTINQHHFWSGFAALVAVYFAWKHLQTVYAGAPKGQFLVASAVFCAMCLWTTQSLGVAMTGALGVFGLLHCFLHEREEKGISYRQVSNVEVLRRWGRSWGLYWALPTLGFHAACIVILVMLGIWPEFLRDVVQWLAGGHYQKTSVLGYFATFSQEVKEMLLPLINGVPLVYLPIFGFRVPQALNLFMIGLLPVIGILSTGYLLPNRFVYRLLQRDDEELLLFWISALGMIISSMTYCTSMHLVSNGSLAFLLGWLALVRWFAKRPRLERPMQIALAVFSVVLLVGFAVGSAVQLVFGAWLPRFPALPESLVYTDAVTPARNLLNVIQLFDEAKAQGRTVFVFNASPSLYLPGDYRNATRFVWVYPLYTSENQIAEIVSDLDKKLPLNNVKDQVFTSEVLSRDDRFSRYPMTMFHMPKLEAYLKAHYMLYTVEGQYLVYRRNS
jgi:hypothetical protein